MSTLAEVIAARDPKITAEIQSHAFTCRGPRNQNGAAVIAKLGAEHKKACGVVTKDVTTDNLISLLFAEDKREAAAAVDGASRVPCGQDVSVLILGELLDGEDHSGKCPKCGMTIRWSPADHGERLTP